MRTSWGAKAGAMAPYAARMEKVLLRFLNRPEFSCGSVFAPLNSPNANSRSPASAFAHRACAAPGVQRLSSHENRTHYVYCMDDFPRRHPTETAEPAAVYREMAASALKRAQNAISPEARNTFLQIAESYRNMASAIEAMARIRGGWL